MMDSGIGLTEITLKRIIAFATTKNFRVTLNHGDYLIFKRGLQRAIIQLIFLLCFLGYWFLIPPIKEQVRAHQEQ